MTDELKIEIDEAKLQKAINSIVRNLPGAEVEMIAKLSRKAIPLLQSAAPKKSGRLAKSQRPYKDRDGAIVVGSRVKHARIINEGGMVRSKQTALAIPFSGAPRRRARGLGLSVIRRQGGNPLLGDDRGLRFTLVDSVTIRATRYVERADHRLRPEVAPTAIKAVELVALKDVEP